MTGIPCSHLIQMDRGKQFTLIRDFYRAHTQGGGVRTRGAGRIARAAGQPVAAASAPPAAAGPPVRGRGQRGGGRSRGQGRRVREQGRGQQAQAAPCPAAGGAAGDAPTLAWTDQPADPPDYPFNENPGFKGNNGDNSVLAYINLFLSDDFIDLMVQETSLYAQQEINKQRPLRRASRLHSWRDTNAIEMRQFIAILFQMGHMHKLPRLGIIIIVLLSQKYLLVNCFLNINYSNSFLFLLSIVCVYGLIFKQFQGILRQTT